MKKNIPLEDICFCLVIHTLTISLKTSALQKFYQEWKKKNTHIFSNNVDSYKCRLLFRVLSDMVWCKLIVQYYLVQREWKIRHLTDTLAVIPTSNSHHFLHRGSALNKMKYCTICSILHLLSKSHYHPSQVHTFTEQEMHKATTFWITSPCFIRCFQFCLGTWSAWAGSSLRCTNGPSVFIGVHCSSIGM